MLKMNLQFHAGDDAVIRFKIADFLNCGTTDEPSYQLMGRGFNQLDESPNAQSDSTTYIHEKTSTATIDSYETEFSYDFHLFPAQKPIMLLYKDGRDQHTGADAQHEYVRVELFNPIESEEEGVEEYTARKFLVSNEVSSYEGEGGQKVSVSGTLKAVGDPVAGKFNIKTLAFTAGTFKGKYDPE